MTDARGDVYSLGLTLYEMLTLAQPFGDLSPSELLRHVSEGQPTRPRRHDPNIPRDLETIVLKATAREPGHRYPTAGASPTTCNGSSTTAHLRAARHPVRTWPGVGATEPATAAMSLTAALARPRRLGRRWAGYAITTRRVESESKRRTEAEQATRRAEQNVGLFARRLRHPLRQAHPARVTVDPPPGPFGRRPSPVQRTRSGHPRPRLAAGRAGVTDPRTSPTATTPSATDHPAPAPARARARARDGRRAPVRP